MDKTLNKWANEQMDILLFISRLLLFLKSDFSSSVKSCATDNKYKRQQRKRDQLLTESLGIIELDVEEVASNRLCFK